MGFGLVPNMVEKTLWTKEQKWQGLHKPVKSAVINPQSNTFM